MKAISLSAICALLLLGGCFQQPLLQDQQQVVRGLPELPYRQPPLVTPEQVTEANAQQTLQALQEELEHARRDLPAATSAEGSPAAPGSR